MVIAAYDPREREHTRGATLVAKHEKEHRLKVERGSCRAGTTRSFEGCEENVKMVYNNTPEDFTDGVVLAYDPHTGEYTRRAEINSTQIPVDARARYCGEAAGFGRNGNGARGDYG